MWQFIGKIYVFFRYKKWPVYLLLVILIALQFTMIIWLAIGTSRLEKNYVETRDSLSMRLNQIYSMVYQMNIKMNQNLK